MYCADSDDADDEWDDEEALLELDDFLVAYASAAVGAPFPIEKSGLELSPSGFLVESLEPLGPPGPAGASPDPIGNLESLGPPAGPSGFFSAPFSPPPDPPPEPPSAGAPG